MRLKLCGNNCWTPEAERLLQREFPRMQVRTAACLRKCGPCGEMLVAVLDGETLKARDPEDLVRLIRGQLEKTE